MKIFVGVILYILVLALNFTPSNFDTIEFFADVISLLITFYFIIKYRRAIALWFRKLKVPRFIIAILATLPFIIFEETANCSSSQCSIMFITVPTLTLYTIILGGLISLFKIRKILLPLILVSAFGLWWEYSFGSVKMAFQAYPIWFAAFIVVYVIISYIYIYIVPMTILTEE